MKNESPTPRSRVQLSEQNLDPLQVNELIVEQRIFLPLLALDSQNPQIHPLIFKITRDKNMDRIIIYLLSEIDLYFLYRFDIAYENIVDLNTQYKLSLKRIADFVQFMRTSLDEAQSHEKQAELQITEQGIDFVLTRIVGGKIHTVMHLSGREEGPELIKAQVAYRYGALRQRIHRKQERIGYLRETVRQKYPHLLKNFKQI